MAINYIKTDGTENGETVAVKVNTVMDSINDTPKAGVSVNTLLNTGIYEVNTGTPNGESGYLKVTSEVGNANKIIQVFSSIDSPMVVSRISSDGGSVWGLWVETPQTIFDKQVMNEFLNTYTKEQVNQMVVNTYTGAGEPSPSLGKSGDRYHRFATNVTTTVSSGVAAQDYEADEREIIIFEDLAAAGVKGIYIIPSDRTVYVDWGLDGMPPLTNFTLTFGGSDIPLDILFQTQSGFDATYSSGYDAVIHAITAGQAYELAAHSLTGKEDDYTKYDDTWYRTPIFSALYDFKKLGSIGSPAIGAVTSTSFIHAETLTVADVPAGVYEIKMSCTFGMDVVNKSFKMRFGQAIAGGSSIFENTSKELKDTSDKDTHEFSYPHVHGGGEIKLDIEVAVESGATGVLYFANMSIERKR